MMPGHHPPRPLSPCSSSLFTQCSLSCQTLTVTQGTWDGRSNPLPAATTGRRCPAPLDGSGDGPCRSSLPPAFCEPDNYCCFRRSDTRSSSPQRPQSGHRYPRAYVSCKGPRHVTLRLPPSLNLLPPPLADSFSQHLPDLSKFRLPNGEDVACVLWNGLYHITGTDIGAYLALGWMEPWLT